MAYVLFVTHNQNKMINNTLFSWLELAINLQRNKGNYSPEQWFQKKKAVLTGSQDEPLNKPLTPNTATTTQVYLQNNSVNILELTMTEFDSSINTYSFSGYLMERNGRILKLYYNSLYVVCNQVNKKKSQQIQTSTLYSFLHAQLYILCKLQHENSFFGTD